MHCCAFRGFFWGCFVFLSVRFTDRGLQATDYVNFAPWAGYPPSPGIEEYLGFIVTFSESNLLCAFVFQFIHFILFHFNLLCFVCFLCVILLYY